MQIILTALFVWSLTARPLWQQIVIFVLWVWAMSADWSSARRG